MSVAGETTGRHVLVVDDEAALRGLLVDFLSRRGLRVAEAADGAAMWRRLASDPVDLVVLDVTMPGENGFELLAALRARGDDVPVVMLTGRDAVGDRLAGLGGGADDYVTKPFEPRELLARIRAVLRRAPLCTRRPMAPAGGSARTVRLGRCLFEPASGRLSEVEGGAEVALTGKELALLRTLVRHASQPLSRERIEELADGIAGASGERGIDARVHRLRRKLEIDSARPRVLRSVRGEGYVLEPGRE